MLIFTRNVNFIKVQVLFELFFLVKLAVLTVVQWDLAFAPSRHKDAAVL